MNAAPLEVLTTDAALLAGLERIVGATGLLRGADMAGYEQGARYGQGQALCVVRPASTEEVSAVLQLCAAQRVPVLPQGANTGLVGASSPDSSGRQVVLSLGRLRRRCEIDALDRSVAVDAGLTLQELNARLEPHGLWFPVDLGANPSIGGMVAANTGGTRLIRYGDVRHNLLALEVVLFEPPGQVLRLGSALRKDNTGHDLKQLFVGTSGACGVITQATLEVHPLPRQSATALVVPAGDGAVGELLQALELELGDHLAAFEGMSGAAMAAAIEHVPNLRNPFAPESLPEFAVLIELEASAPAPATGASLQDRLDHFLESQFERGSIANAALGNAHALWQLRHGLSEGARALGRPVAFDVSVPRSRIMAFRRAALAMLAQDYPHLCVTDFGHIADGGMHFNVVWPHAAVPAYDAAVVQALRDRLYALVVDEFKGSFSAEHGIGPHNLRYYQRYTAPAALALAAGIRQLLDPRRLSGAVDLGAGPALPGSGEASFT